MHLSWPLIGRSEELRAVDTALSATDVSGIVISGAAGVGKSRVAREALSAAELRGWAAHLVIGTHSGRIVPLGAFAAWTEAGVADSTHLLGGVITSLGAATSARGVLVVVDDVHLLDDLSAFVVNQIVQREAAKVLLTVRLNEPIPPSVQEIWTVSRFERLTLHPLTLEGASALVAATLGGPVDPDSAKRMWELTRGNTLYLRHIVEQEVADGRIAKDENGLWRWNGDPILASSLVELVESRIGGLPSEVGDVIDTLAVGEPIELATLARIADPCAIEDAESRGLITVRPVGAVMAVRLAHPIYGEVRRSRAPATKLRRLRGLVARELARSPTSDDLHVLVRRATLGLESDQPPDPDTLTKAARGAVWLADLALAERLADAAFSAGGGVEPELVRAHALSWLCRGKDAERVLSGIDPDDLVDDGERGRLAFLRASNLLWALGDSTSAKALIDETSRGEPGDCQRYVDSFLTVYWFAMDQPHAALSAAAGLELERMPSVVGAELAWVLTTINADAGRSSAAVRHAEAGYVAATRSFDAPHMRFNIADSHISALLLAGHIGAASDVALHVQQQAADLPGAAHLLGAAMSGRAALAAGNLRSACEHLEKACIGLCADHSVGWGFRYLIPRIQALAMTGRLDAAMAALATLQGVRRPFRLLDYEQHCARAWIAAGQGAITEAIGLTLKAAERASSDGRFAAEVLCRQTAVQFGDYTSADRLKHLEKHVEGPRVGLASRLAAAMGGGDAPQLASLSEAFEAMGDLVAAIDAASHAALTYRRLDRRGSAFACATRAESLAERSGVRTPALRRAVEPMPLTEREREVAMLVGQGMSTRQIAERLTLSVRTVESHTYRAMSKTGMRSRNELAALLRRQGTP
ncbi:helix-turn-helix transcriptional regulator [Mycolicibacterium iranicum]|uniref:Helix-turn-helix transcriptional regulator n=1 Tax=Mycolicibacterium iranicum TaxID=912594 RepID=A0A178LWR8_MYCIR|nr:LuxR family transcriptional regulator [Mycolicibacterium iranicum]OAN37858.1 helix-turn-helix transcriptional regulator [Mycolicibacterium iranicum]